MKKRTFRIISGVGAAALAMTAATAGASFAGQSTPAATVPVAADAAAQADSFIGKKISVPTNLVPPPGNALSSVFTARGVQNYGCTNGAWALLEPAATLNGIEVSPVKRVSAIHFRGPSWQSESDGSLVEGTGPVSAPSATPNSIPQLLITAKTLNPERTQTGTFAGVTFIQRLATVGGIAPAAGCSAGQTTAVKYTAVYRFFKKA